MFVDPKYKTEKMVDSKNGRPHLETAYIEKGDMLTAGGSSGPVNNRCRLVATNGNALSYVPVLWEEGDVMNGKNRIGVAALKEIRKQKGRSKLKVGENGGCVQIGGALHPLSEETFPDYLTITPKTVEGSLRLGINPKLLFDLAQSIGASTHIELEIPEDPHTGVRVTDPDDDRVLGIIMPMRLKG